LIGRNYSLPSNRPLLKIAARSWSNPNAAALFVSRAARPIPAILPQDPDFFPGFLRRRLAYVEARTSAPAYDPLSQAPLRSGAARPFTATEKKSPAKGPAAKPARASAGI